jgi:hypothetical protein
MSGGGEIDTSIANHALGCVVCSTPRKTGFPIGCRKERSKQPSGAGLSSRKAAGRNRYSTWRDENVQGVS